MYQTKRMKVGNKFYTVVYVSKGSGYSFIKTELYVAYNRAEAVSYIRSKLNR